MKRTKATAILVAIMVALCWALPVPSAAASEANSNTLTLQQALDMAYKHSPDLRKAELEVDKAEALRDKAFENVTFIPTGGLVSPAYQQVMNAYQQAAIAAETAKKAQQSAKDSLTLKVINAYVSALKARNSLETAKMNLSSINDQIRVAKLCKEIGLLSDYDYASAVVNQKKMEDQAKSAELAYGTAMATLRALVGADESWNPELISTPVLTKYQRDSLTVEIARGVSQSISVFNAWQNVKAEEAKANWVILDTPTKVQEANREEASLSYEQAKTDARSTIEQLYYNLDALEKQIEIATTAYEQAEKDLKVAQYKYELGLIPYTSSTAGSQSLSAAKLAAESARITVEGLKADLVNAKANFAFLTGKQVYDEADWNMGAAAETNSGK